MVWFSLSIITLQELAVYSSHDSVQANDLVVNSTFLILTEVNLFYVQQKVESGGKPSASFILWYWE